MLLNLLLAGVNGACIYINYRTWKTTGSKFALGLLVYTGACAVWCLTGLL